MRFILLIFLFVLSIHAQNITWHSDFEQAHKEALKNDKMMMILLIKKDSIDCSNMLSNTFMNKPYNKKINKLFVSVLLTKGQKETYPIEMLYTMEYPAIFFLDKQELFIGENIFGFIDSEKFQNHLNLYF